MGLMGRGEKEFFLEPMEAFLGWKRLRYSFSSTSPVSEATHPCLRIAVMTRGRAHVRMSGRAGSYEMSARKGDVLVILPYGEFDHWPAVKNGNYWMFQAIVLEGHVRLLYGDVQGCYWYHTSRPVSPEGRNCDAALGHLVGRPALDETGPLLVEAILRVVREDLVADQPVVESRSLQTYQRACNYIIENYQQAINRDSVAREMKVTPQHLSKLFKLHHEMGFNRTLKSLRLRSAENLLTHSNLSVEAIALQSGFSSSAYFVKEFKKAYGVSPGAYRG
ncbi:MAG: helix-turn-helix domain-containing protein [Planctomycetota bacterium]|jgi:AraC-like DNA-binding protein